MMPFARRTAQAALGEGNSALFWPFDVSHEPTLKIGELKTALAAEFPLLTLSKIRHYESIELIHPHRTSSNQRLFSQADCARLRFILREQRDRYLPLEQIRELLHQLDAGEQPEDVHPARMRVLDEVPRRPQPGTRLKVREVADLTGASIEEINALVEAGVLALDSRGRLTSQAPEIVRLAQGLFDAGFDLRQVRAVRTSAHAHAVLLASNIATERAKSSPAAGERALATAAESAQVMSHLYRALLTENIEVELR